MTTFTYIETFAGIGGFRQALDKLGGQCVFASEIDKFAAQAYEILYGEKPAGDITKIDAKDVPDHDLLVGGFPCQAFSVAGKRKGFEDTRGTLFFEIARIAAEKKPKALLLENVKGLVNHDKGRTLDTMIRTLNDIGYIVDFDVLNSKYFGVPQNRERMFIVAIRDDLIEQEDWSEETTKGQTVVPKGKRRLMKYEWLKAFNFDWPEQEEVTTRLRDILESNVDEKYYLSDDKTAKLIAQLEANPSEDDIPLENMGRLAGLRNRTDRVFAYQDDKKRSTAQENIYLRDGAIADSVTVGHMPKYLNSPEEVRPVLTPERIDKRQNGRRFKEDGEESFTLTAQDRHGIAIKEATTKGYAVAAEGDAVNFQFPDSKTRRGRVGKQIANTLEASSINQGVVESPPKYRIRKLTPLECFRLQNFPDEAHQKLVDAGISDSQRYKMAGNAVTVNVIEAIGKRLLPLITESERKYSPI